LTYQKYISKALELNSKTDKAINLDSLDSGAQVEIKALCTLVERNEQLEKVLREKRSHTL